MLTYRYRGLAFDFDLGEKAKDLTQSSRRKAAKDAKKIEGTEF
jgi:hypothetical protein